VPRNSKTRKGNLLLQSVNLYGQNPLDPASDDAPMIQGAKAPGRDYPLSELPRSKFIRDDISLLAISSVWVFHQRRRIPLFLAI
jgi:hypothetical protein